jgi:two-component system chemotaxis response regulator CheB/two-component system response regulator WspF
MRIGIVNDMMLAVETIRQAIATVPGHKIAWVAHDGLEAVERCARDTPDLILMDLIMPRLDGVEATRRIMARNPCAIVVVTADVQRNSSKVFEAMGAGALDAVDTPAYHASHPRRSEDALLAKIETIRKLTSKPAPARSPAHNHAGRSAPNLLVAIGASAGGPTALAEVLSSLPSGFAAPVVIVQHVDEHFAKGLAAWLASRCALEVRVAAEGDQPRAGRALLAGRDSHLVFTCSSRVGYTRNPADCSYRPSVDVFFRSVVRHWRGRVLGVLLTGMGRDGAEGLLALKASGHQTIAQDRETSAVYGMPKAAADLNAATEILALDKIGPRLRNIVAHESNAHV